MTTKPKKPNPGLRVLTRELVALLPPTGWLDVAGAITDEEIKAYDGPVPELPPYEWKFGATEEQMRKEHIQRIVALMRSPDSWDPLQICDGSEDEGARFLYLDDGHHRLRAAIVLGLPSLPILYCGLWKSIRTAFPASYRAGMLRQTRWRPLSQQQNWK